jgi:hypothetical protein
MVDRTGWQLRRPLAHVADIDGVRSITVVDRLARATVWSMTFAPSLPPDQPESTVDDVVDAEPARIADDVLDTVRAVELLCPRPGTIDGWFEVILISARSYRLVRPFGETADALIVELGLDARSANLAAARQMFDDLLLPYRDGVPAADPVGDTSPSDPSASPDGLPRRPGTPPSPGREPKPARLVDDDVLHRVAAALRSDNDDNTHIPAGPR